MRWGILGPGRISRSFLTGLAGSATEHAVVDTGPSRCRVQMSVPWWASAYLGVLGLALLRIRRRVESRVDS